MTLFQLKTYHEVIDEIYYNVKHLEPWVTLEISRMMMSCDAINLICFVCFSILIISQERGSRKTAGNSGMCGEFMMIWNVCNFLTIQPIQLYARFQEACEESGQEES